MTPIDQITAVRQQLIADHARLFSLENEVKAVRERITAGSNFLAGIELAAQAAKESTGGS
jgi:hypothetical protein